MKIPEKPHFISWLILIWVQTQTRELLRSLLTWIIPCESCINGSLSLQVTNVELHVPPRDLKVEKLLSQTPVWDS